MEESRNFPFTFGSFFFLFFLYFLFLNHPTSRYDRSRNRLNWFLGANEQIQTFIPDEECTNSDLIVTFVFFL